MATYFNRTDLDARLQKTSCWVSEEATKIANNLKYTGTIDNCRMNNLSYVVACVEAAECYIPITTAAEDGETNCLTEARMENIFDNISKITGICFVPKNATYEAVGTDHNSDLEGAVDVDGTAITDYFGNTMDSLATTKEALSKY